MKVRLGDYIKEYSVKNKLNEDIPVYSVTNTQGFCRDYFGKEVASKNKTTYKIVPKGYFAYNPSRINVGSVDWQRDEERVIVSPLYNVFSVSKELNQQYLYYYLKSNYALQRIGAVATGSVRDNLKFSMLCNFPIELPSIREQHQIVNVLNKISKIIKLRQKEIEMLDELTKARFVEMFGEMKETTKLSRYITELRAGKSLAGTKICKNKVLKTGAATFGYFDKTQFKYYPEDYEPNPLHKVEDGDVIISRMNTPNLVGSCSYVYKAPEDTYYPDRLWKTIVSENTNPIFLWHLLWQQEIRKQIKENSFGTSGTMNNISKVKMLNIKAIDVPIELQNQFADFVRETDKSRLKIQKSLESTQELFDSLMQKYFG